MRLTFKSNISVGVIVLGSTSGLGRYGDDLPATSSTREAHCLGSPTNLLDVLSYPVWTRCWKLEGVEISGFFFFLENIFTLEKAEQSSSSEKRVHVIRVIRNFRINTSDFSPPLPHMLHTRITRSLFIKTVAILWFIHIF